MFSVPGLHDNAFTFNTAVKHVGSIFLNLNFGYDKWNYVAEKSWRKIIPWKGENGVGAVLLAVYLCSFSSYVSCLIIFYYLITILIII